MQDIFPPQPGAIPKSFGHFQIKFGEAQAAIPCVHCRRLENRGFFIISGSDAALLCIKCNVAAIYRLQETNPGETFLDVDVEVRKEDRHAAEENVRKAMPEASDTLVRDLVKAVIDGLS